MEEGQPATATTSRRDTKIIAARRRFYSLNVSKLTDSTSRGHRCELEGIAMSSATAQQPRITQVSNVIKVEGFLDGARASLTLEMVKSADCLANFECRLRTVDDIGEEVVIVSRVQQRKRHRPITGDQSLFPCVQLQLLGLLHHLDVKLIMTSQSTEKLDSKMDTHETKLSSGQFKTAEHLETKIEEL